MIDMTFWVEGPRILLHNEATRLHHMNEHVRVQEWVELGFWTMADMGAPKNIGPCRVTSVAQYPVNKIGKLPDTAAWNPTVKALIDGFVKFGLWPDDTPDQVVEISFYPPTRKEGLKSERIGISIESVQ